MRVFSGFAAGMRAVRLPEPLFTVLLPDMDDLDELKVTLHVLYRLGEQEGAVRYVRHRDLLADDLLLSGLASPAALEAALARAVERGTLLLAEVTMEGQTERIYLPNTPRGRAAFDALRRGEPLPDALTPPVPTSSPSTSRTSARSPRSSPTRWRRQKEPTRQAGSRRPSARRWR
jgi:DNA replication protein